MSFLNDFGVQPVLLIAQIINFVILLLVLQRFLYKPVMKMLEERRQKVVNSVKQAEEIERRFEESARRQEEILAKARSEAAELIESAKEEAKALQSQIQKETADSAQESIKRTKEALELERKKMIAEARAQMIEMVAMATERVTSETVKGPENEKLAQKALEEIAQ